MSKEYSLKPCPFCGKTHIIIDTWKREPNGYNTKVFCSYCFGQASNQGFDSTEDEAVEKAVKHWNMRLGE